MIDQSGRYDVQFESRALAVKSMKLDPDRTKEIQKYMRSMGFDRVPRDPAGRELLQKYLEAWVMPHASRSPKGGREWPAGREGWTVGILSSSNTRRMLNFLGSAFDYVHFITAAGGEGAVILWREPSGEYSEPEVWTGPFEDFLAVQESGDEEGPLAFLKWNETFENGFVWAITELGGFEAFGYYLDDDAARAIEMDPGILHQDAIDRILKGHMKEPSRPLMEERLANFPDEIQRAVRARLAESAAVLP